MAGAGAGGAGAGGAGDGGARGHEAGGRSAHALAEHEGRGRKWWSRCCGARGIEAALDGAEDRAFLGGLSGDALMEAALACTDEADFRRRVRAPARAATQGDGTVKPVGPLSIIGSILARSHSRDGTRWSFISWRQAWGRETVPAFTDNAEVTG